MFPERFYRPFDDIHHQIFSILDNVKAQKIVIAAPRGVGKTSINNLLLPAKAALFHTTDYIVPVSCSATVAKQQSENLKQKLMQNSTVQRFFGITKTKNFSKEQWVVEVAGREICIMPRGSGQQVRGLLFRDSRPGLIIVDDLEDPENLLSEDQRKKQKKWFYGDLMNSIDRGRDDWRIVVIGTIVHQNALIVELLESDDWHSANIPICDPDFTASNVPNFMSVQQIEDLRDEFRRAGEIDIFYREYMNNPTPLGEDATFRQSYFKYFDPIRVEFDKAHCDTVVCIDPSKTDNPENAASAIVAVSYDREKHAMFVRDIVHGHWLPDDLYKNAVDMIRRVGAQAVGIDTGGSKEFIRYPFQNYLLNHHIFLEVHEFKNRHGADEKGKKARVRGLLPLYRMGRVFHNKACTEALEAQLMSFPRPRRWDIMDALSYSLQLLDVGDRYDIPIMEEGYMEQPEEEELEEYNKSRRAVEREFADLDPLPPVPYRNDSWDSMFV